MSECRGEPEDQPYGIPFLGERTLQRIQKRRGLPDAFIRMRAIVDPTAHSPSAEQAPGIERAQVLACERTGEAETSRHVRHSPARMSYEMA